MKMISTGMKGMKGIRGVLFYRFHPVHPCKKYSLLCLIIPILAFTLPVNAQTVQVLRKSAERRIDVVVEGKPFTSYRWDERILRPVLYPIFSSGGSYVTRGFPIDTRNGDTIDHPHQVGSSFSYGNVNGIDFWNSSI